MTCKTLRDALRNIPAELAIVWSAICFIFIFLPVALPMLADLAGFIQGALR